MVHFCRDKYKLYLRWSDIVYHSDGVATLEGCTFSGPVLQIAAKIEAPDSIDLDLTPQTLSLLDSYYIVKLSWQEVEYQESGVLLKGATLTNDFLKTIHKFSSGDYIVINTEKHEEETHAFNLVYESQIVRRDQTPYKFEG